MSGFLGLTIERPPVIALNTSRKLIDRLPKRVNMVRSILPVVLCVTEVHV